MACGPTVDVHHRICLEWGLVEHTCEYVLLQLELPLHAIHLLSDLCVDYTLYSLLLDHTSVHERCEGNLQGVASRVYGHCYSLGLAPILILALERQPWHRLVVIGHRVDVDCLTNAHRTNFEALVQGTH